MVSMNETNTANSSSAAAVADGASSAAHTKTVGVTSIKSASHVKLLIKSSNQQYEDHVIESDLLWTVKRLKSHLSVVYPSKPPVAEQKLIYSGHLLNDNVQLKDVIRIYKDVYTQNHIIHLVYTPKILHGSNVSKINKTKLSPAQSYTSGAENGLGGSEVSSVRTNDNIITADGLRQRHLAGDSNGTHFQSNTDATQQQQQSLLFHQQMHPYFMNSQLMSAAAMSCPQFPQNAPNSLDSSYNVQAMIIQQTAMYNWMQQVYSQYMEQYLRLSSSGGGDTATISGYPSSQMSIAPPNFSHLFQQQFASRVMTPVVSDTTATAAAAGNVERRERPDQQQEAVAAARFPNLPQDEQDNRDWLDNFFSITRFALFLTLLYFNSSPLRCFVVVIIAGGIYLYHIGVFRFRHERNNNNLNRNNNAAQNAAVDQIRQGVDQQENAAVVGVGAAERNDNNENNVEGETERQTETTIEAPENANNESVLSTIRTFVVSFFTSLLPETPAL